MTILNYYYLVMSSDEPSTSSTVTQKDNTVPLCTVCGDVANGKRYGTWACLGCIVFFRRTVLRKMKYKCQREERCEVTVAIQIRDVIGPRKPKSGSTVSQNRSSASPLTPLLPSNPSTPSEFFPPTHTENLDQNLDLNVFVDLQKDQWENHKNHVEEEEKFSDGCVFMKNTYHRRATSSDINLSLKLAIQDSNSFASQFQFFRELSEENRIKVLREFSIGFMILDQAVRTKNDADPGFWILQNDSFLGLHPDFKFEEMDENLENLEKEKSHFDFVTQLIDTISEPIKKLEIEGTEIAILKILMFLTSSSNNDNHLRNHFLQLLMDHLTSKDAENGPEKFGEIILLISSIRCTIKSFYNLTKISDLFDVRNFEHCVRNVLVD
ncbi:Protein CBG20720 [Caenorhabditis briggsae]|uniref:Protein CBG20720 n=1 Tax=Caenorhabditis briggsae TaxID=6238 RepID=A8XYG3_CAEBR|nr:Protein CBG20720 [Caenorhabditis briggsae]CAP37680.2 Protein CBG20720 [Caenorhabditis briggsae]